MKRFIRNLHKMTKELRIASYILSKSRIIKTGSTTLTKIQPNNKCKALVLHGSSLGSNIGFKLNPVDLNNIFLTPFIFSVLIGILLGDGHIRVTSKNGNPQIQFNQGFINLEYILYIFQIFNPLVTHLPSLIQRRDGSFYLLLYTRCLACLYPLYDIFIVDGVKRILSNISQFLTPVSLAFWAMDVRSRTPEGFYLNTHSFSFEEQLILKKALLDNFGILCNIHKHGAQFKLYIRAQSMTTFRTVVTPHFTPSMNYKLFKKI